MNRFFSPRRVGLLVASGVLGALAFPIAFSRTEVLPSGVLEPLAFVCLVPGLVAVRGLRPHRAFAAGVLAGLAFFVGTFWWVTHAMSQFSPLPWVVCVALMVLLAAACAAHWGMAFALVRFFAERSGWAVGLTLAPVWVATELTRSWCPGFPWANLGYSQARNLWLSQIASVVGVYGIAGLVAWVNGALYEVLRAQLWRERAFPTGLLVSAGALLAASHGFGALRVRSWDQRLARAEHVRVAVVQGNIDQRLKLEQGSHAAMVLASYNPATTAADRDGADIIVWPEGSFPGDFVQGQAWNVDERGLGQKTYKSHLVVGVDILDPSDRRRENAAFVITPDLRVAFKYAKYHLVAFGEYIPFQLDRYLPIRNLVPGRFKPGDSLDPVETPKASLGIEICFDALFPELSRTYVQKGAQVLLNMTNDAWYGFSSAPFQFLRMVELRAIETGRPVARAANTGISGFIDPVGRISQATPLGLVETGEGLAALERKVAPEWRIANLPLVSETTVHVVTGDVPAYGAALFCLFGVGWGVRRGRRAGPRRFGSLGI